MLQSLLLSLAGLVAAVPTVRAASAAPVLDASGPSDTVAVDTYDLSASYAQDPARGRVGLVLEQSDGGSALACELTRQRAQLLRLRDGKPRVLATGAGLDVRQALELTVRRRPGSVRVYEGPRLIAEAYDGEFASGRCGATAGCAQPSDLFVQELAPIELADDFFVGDERGDLWQMLRGAFKVDVYWDPKQKVDDRPIGACWFANEGPGEHLATTGELFWDDYACEVVVHPGTESTVGLAFRVHDADNYAALTLSTQPDGSVAELVEVRGGQLVSLAELRGDCKPGHWYRLRAEVVGGEVRASAADVPLKPVQLSGWPSGKVGLYAKTAGECRFDDLSVRSRRRVEPVPKAQPAGPWRFAAGSWAADKGSVTCRAASTAVALAGVGDWADCGISAEVQPSPQGQAGVLARWTERGGYALVLHRTGGAPALRLLRLARDAGPVVLAEAPLAAGDQAAVLGLTTIGTALCGTVDGVRVVRAFDNAFGTGQAGLMALDGQASFAHFTATDELRDESVSVLIEDGTGRTRPGAEHGAFDRFIGDLWQPVRGACVTTMLGDEPTIRLTQGALRYYMPRFGDVALSADVLQTGNQALAFAICADPSGQAGYTLTLTGQALELARSEQTVQSVPLALDAAPLRVSLRRDGPFVVGRAGSALVSFRDPEPLGDGSAIVRAEGTAILDNLDLGATHALAYRFDRVEPDWNEASGEWMFHSGMACIPWAYWLSGDGRQGPAALWNRVPAPADLALHFDVSEYTEGYANGDHLHFPYHDISVVLAGDGGNLDSGYRFVIGADGGLRTRLLRQGQTVAMTDSPRFRIVMGSHCNTPRAIEVVIVRNGGNLRLLLNRAEALAYTDPQPLGAGLVALGVDKCRANFRDLFLYRDRTWELPVGAAAFSPGLSQ